MGHMSPGYMYVRLWNADILKDDYCVVFSRLRHAWYPPMSDSNEPDWEMLDSYSVSVMRWYSKDKRGSMKALDGVSETVEINDIGKDEAKKIYWNLKNREIPFREVKRYFDVLRKARDAG